jgi:Carboxypeptidase regulatory-like domain/TonB dependent receptor
MFQRVRLSIFFVVLVACITLAFVPSAQAQTLGGITGTVTDASGAAVVDALVTLVGDQTTLTRTQKTNSSGSYEFVNLPIGTYTLTFTHDSFQTQRIPSITVQADRTATVNAALKVGQVSTTVTVVETPLVNAVDTTNGYVLDRAQLEAIPLPTGSFTGLAILSPGVNAELTAGAGVNTGLGNQPIWANGQRDTSNTFLFNGVDASNLFNGKSTSSVSSGRIVNNTGVTMANNTTAEPVQTTASPYLAIGQALPTPAPETIQELRANASMYDAQQGSTSGAHIDLSTSSGTNSIHGSGYLHRGTNAWNAAPYFNNQDPNIPDSEKVPGLHREVGGGTVGGPLIKNKLFGFISYQHIHDSDQEIGSSRVAVPYYLSDDRSPNGLATAAEETVPSATCAAPPCPYFTSAISLPATIGTGPGQINPISYGLLNYKLPNGQYLIPSADGFTPSINFPEDTFTLGTARFLADQAVANLDFIATPKDTLALKYYYQHDPTTAPYAYSGVAGFSQHLDAGSQVASITNTQMLTPNLSVAEVFGFIREKVYSTVQEPFTPSDFAQYVQNLVPGTSLPDATINTFGSSFFPGLTIADNLGNPSYLTNSYLYNTDDVFGAALSIGEGAVSQGAFTGVFQNRFMPSANAIWTKGRHTITFGGSFSYTQLHPRDDRTNKGMIGFNDFSDFLGGVPVTYNINGFIATSFLQGDANRHYRSNETGEYVQDKFQIRSNLSLTFGLRYDYHGGLTETNGELYNFEPSLYSYDAVNDVINSNGFIIAGNNKLHPTSGVSDSTLTGRQWGLAPRLGVAWSPKSFNSKLVVRAGWGMYYDRGELFTYLSPGFASGVIPGGPFGVAQSPPYVNSQSCSAYAYTACAPYDASSPACLAFGVVCGSGFENPWGPALGPPPTGDPSTLSIPNAAAITTGLPLFSFAVYNRKNKLPYTLNQTLDVQWQPRNDLSIEVGYVGNLGRHEVVPVPFNEPQIATPTHPIRPGTPVEQDYTYGYTVVTSQGSFTPINLPNPPAGEPQNQPYQETFEGGNIDLRVPYIGYSAESESYTAAGISAYNALQTHVEKRLSHGMQVGFSYTYSHSLDEQSAMGLFYNGNNPLDLHSGYGNSDFDRTHVFNFSYLFRMHNFFTESSWQGKLADGWALEGVTVLQSGQPYSVIDYSGAVGSIYFGTSDGITNPIVPLASNCTPKSAVTGASGADPGGTPALNASCFTLPLLNPGDLGGGIPSNDPYETNFVSNGQRNIFRQPWQKRADISIVKDTKLSERFRLKYTFEVFNLTNTASFDIPVDNVSQNPSFSDFPYQGQPATIPPCDTTYQALYVCPSLGGLGVTNKTIGSPRQIQMSLSLLF